MPDQRAVENTVQEKGQITSQTPASATAPGGARLGNAVIFDSEANEPVAARSILVADDDPLTRKLLKQSLENGGFAVHLCESGEEALEAASRKNYPVLLSDIRMWGMDGLELVGELKKRQLLTVPIVMTGFGSLEGAVEAIRRGAFDYISKPFRPEELVQLAERAWNHWRGLMEEIRKPQGPPVFDPKSASLSETTGVRFIGRSHAIVSVYKMVARAALTTSTVLITGESGTGKELIARAIHRNGNRPKGPFIAVNCGAISETLLESELFGYVRGAFTGATGEKKGLFEEASGGTIFLDEIGDISPAMQVKLLRVLQYGEIKPVGCAETRVLDTRVVAATHRDLDRRVKEGSFREDLYYRLKVISIELPPLRARVEDIKDLAKHFLTSFCSRNHRYEMNFSEACYEVLRNYDWPGNIRELEHAVEYAVAMAQGSVIFPENLPAVILNRQRAAADTDGVTRIHPTAGMPPQPGMATSNAHGAFPTSSENPQTMAETLAQNERQHILTALAQENHNRTRAAKRLGIDRVTLYRKMWKYGITIPR